MFKREWFQSVDQLPPYRRTVRYWDMAATDVEAAKKKSKRADPKIQKTHYNSDFKYMENIYCDTSKSYK